MRPSRLSEAEVVAAMAGLAEWTREGNVIRRQFTFSSFPEAIAFAVRLGFEAERADHHPDILVNYKRVTLSFSTHSEGGLTRLDFEGARAADAIASSHSAP